MRSLIFAALGASAFVFCSCSTLDKQSSEMLADPPAVDRSRYLDVQFIKQETAQCGPATLAMVAAYAGRPVVIEDLTKSVLTESKDGSLQSALIGGARRLGLVTVPLSGFRSLIREVDAGHPVIVLQNLGLSWWPKWHYAVVTGYDLNLKTLRLHSGPNKNKEVSFRDFEIDWASPSHWGLVVLPPGKLSATGSEFDHVTSTAILESLQKTSEAEESYNAILKRWPESLGAMLGLGNIYYSSGRIEKAVAILFKAQKTHPHSEAAKHNYGVALKRSQKI